MKKSVLVLAIASLALFSASFAAKSTTHTMMTPQTKVAKFAHPKAAKRIKGAKVHQGTKATRHHAKSSAKKTTSSKTHLKKP